MQNLYTNCNICSAFLKASDHVGAPTDKRSPQQASFRWDLTIICEAATVTNAQVVLTDDRFIQNMIKHQPVYHSAIERVLNLIYLV